MIVHQSSERAASGLRHRINACRKHLRRNRAAQRLNRQMSGVARFAARAPVVLTPSNLRSDNSENILSEMADLCQEEQPL